MLSTEIINTNEVDEYGCANTKLQIINFDLASQYTPDFYKLLYIDKFRRNVISLDDEDLSKTNLLCVCVFFSVTMFPHLLRSDAVDYHHETHNIRV